MGRTRIGSCHNPADAALVRSAFAAHDIACVIGAEQHANLLGGLHGGLLSLDIWVDDADAETARQLLDEIRAPAADDDLDEDEAEESRALETRLAVRRSTGVVVLLAICITFGTAHMFTGAWKRGLAFAAVEALGIYYLAHAVAAGGLLVGAAIFVDLFGALARVRTPAPKLPRAQLRR